MFSSDVACLFLPLESVITNVACEKRCEGWEPACGDDAPVCDGGGTLGDRGVGLDVPHPVKASAANMLHKAIFIGAVHRGAARGIQVDLPSIASKGD